MKNERIISFISHADACEMHDVIIQELDDLYQIAIDTAASKKSKNEIATFFKKLALKK